jgi:hypothetical protein
MSITRKHTVVLRSAGWGGYWAKAGTIEEAVRQAKKAGMSGNEKYSLYLYTGEGKDVSINGMGDIAYQTEDGQELIRLTENHVKVTFKK